jgi:hypothetical protein
MDPQEHSNKRASFPMPFGPRAGGYGQIPLHEQNTAYHHGNDHGNDRGVLLADASTFERSASHARSISSERDASPGRWHDPERDGYNPTGYNGGGVNAPWQPAPQRGNGSYAY